MEGYEDRIYLNTLSISYVLGKRINFYDFEVRDLFYVLC
jgi:hypothetical protein